MGLVRFVLALSVAVWHFGSPGSTGLVSGYIAVISFFMISGFYMSMIINENYATGPDWIQRFYLSRALRLFPVYLVIVVLTLSFWRIAGVPLVTLLNLDLPLHPLAWLAVMLSNIGIVGLDIAALAKPDFTDLSIMRVVGPAWSLGIELQFYLVAPFLVRRSLRLCALFVVAAISLRLMLLGFSYDPWRYFFAPADWCFFLLGHFAYRCGALITSDPLKYRLGVFCCVAVPSLAYWAGISEIHDLDRPAYWLYYLGIASSLPFLFHLTKDSKWDRVIGNLSYPIYLVHPLVYCILLTLLGAPPSLYGAFGGLYYFGPVWCGFALCCVFAVAVALHWVIEKPVESIRGALRREQPVVHLTQLATAPVSE